MLAVPPFILSRRQNMPADSVRATNAEEEPEVLDPGRATRPAIESEG